MVEKQNTIFGDAVDVQSMVFHDLVTVNSQIRSADPQ